MKGFITCRKLLTGLGSGLVESNALGFRLCGGIVIGGGTPSATDFFRRRKNEDFLFTTWRTDGLGAGASFLMDCFLSFGGSGCGCGSGVGVV